MPFKRGSTYRTRLVLPGYGVLPETSLGTARKSDALAIENAIREVHRRGLHDPRLFAILDAIQGRGRGRSGPISPADVLVAVKAPDGPEAGLSRLCRRLDDPTLQEAVEAYLQGAAARGITVTREDRLAFPTVLRYARARGAERLSDLAGSDAVTAVLVAIERGEKKSRNAVARYERRAISKLLTFHLGRAARDVVMKEVRFEAEDDRRRLRETVVTPQAIGRLIDELRAGYYQEGDEAAPLVARLAVATGATVRPLTETTNANLRPLESGAGLLYLAGTKRIRGSGSGRDRPVTIPMQLMPDVLRFYRPHDPDGRLLPIERSRFDTMFQKARKRAGLMEAVLDGEGRPTPLRPHDLRRVFAMMGEQAGVSRTKLGQGGLGHTNLRQTDRYLSRETRVDEGEAARIADMMGW